MNILLTIIVAGGSGLRMGSELPKQFLLVDNKPILMHTIENIHSAVENFINSYSAEMRVVDKIVNKIVVVLPKDHIALWEKLCREHNFTIAHSLAHGGANRFESVSNGLRSEPDADFVAVHDGVRPFTSHAVVAEALAAAIEHGAAIPVIDLSDSIRQRLPQGGSVIRNRSEFALVQTPQLFRGEWIREAYGQPYCEIFTDDASVVESAGHEITLTRGDVSNIKITTPFDMKIAEQLCKK